MTAPGKSIERWVHHSLRTHPPRSKSLLITLFGDLLLPHTPAVWLGDLSRLLEPFGVSAQLVRTSGFRLVEEGWLQTGREGRRSRYALTPMGRRRIEHAYPRIYDPPVKAWDRRWTIVIHNKAVSTKETRLRLRTELAWEGFGILAPGILVHPRAPRDEVDETLARLGLLKDVVVLDAQDRDALDGQPVMALAQQCWNLGAVALHYQAFLKRFQQVKPLVEAGISDEIAFVVQTMLIHEFRRAVLHDPRLPAALLPAAWPGYLACELCSSMYRSTSRQAFEHLASVLRDSSEVRLKLSPTYLKRFAEPER